MSDKAEMYNGVGFAIAVLALCIGIGGCNYIEAKGIAKVAEAKAKLVAAEKSGKVVDTECKCGKIVETVEN